MDEEAAGKVRRHHGEDKLEDCARRRGGRRSSVPPLPHVEVHVPEGTLILTGK